MSAIHVLDNSIFTKPRHIKYWLRCLKTHLPTLYQSNDATRMTLAFFTISALDLLDALEPNTSTEERTAYVDWIYRCQHPEGGFRGFTGTDLGHLRNEKNECWDPANLAATFFALATLIILGDDLNRVKIRETLNWLKGLQLENGSFGEARTENGRISGVGDARFGYCAASVRWILHNRGGGSEMNKEEDIDVQALARSITCLQTYEGGLGNASFQEANAGWTYCGISTLSLLGMLPTSRSSANGRPSHEEPDYPLHMERLLYWLVSRQTSILQESEEYEVSEKEAAGYTPSELSTPPVLGVALSPAEISRASILSIEVLPEELLWAGFSGRCNKTADTCYSFWNGGAMAVLDKVHVMDFNANRRHLLEKTQHLIGGFGKLPGDPPDIMHSYLGLAALACMREPELKSIDPALCFSIGARDRGK